MRDDEDAKVRVQIAVRTMSAELRGQYAQVRKLLRDGTVTDANARYCVGQIVLSVRNDSALYGPVSKDCFRHRSREPLRAMSRKSTRDDSL
jgi:hypothetical protein